MSLDTKLILEALSKHFDKLDATIDRLFAKWSPPIAALEEPALDLNTATTMLHPVPVPGAQIGLDTDTAPPPSTEDTLDAVPAAQICLIDHDTATASPQIDHPDFASTTTFCEAILPCSGSEVTMVQPLNDKKVITSTTPARCSTHVLTPTSPVVSLIHNSLVTNVVVQQFDVDALVDLAPEELFTTHSIVEDVFQLDLTVAARRPGPSALWFMAEATVYMEEHALGRLAVRPLDVPDESTIVFTTVFGTTTTRATNTTCGASSALGASPCPLLRGLPSASVVLMPAAGATTVEASVALSYSCVPTRCSTICPRQLFISPTSTSILGTNLKIFNSASVMLCAALVRWGQAMQCVDWQLWPPTMSLVNLLDCGMLRPMPWPSFIVTEVCSLSWNASWVWKPPWPLYPPGLVVDEEWITLYAHPEGLKVQLIDWGASTDGHLTKLIEAMLEYNAELPSCDSYFDTIHSNKKLPLSLQASMTAACPQIPVLTFLEVPAGQVLDIHGDPSVLEAVRILSEHTIRATPVLNSEPMTPVAWQGWYFDVIDYSAFISWKLNTVELGYVSVSAESAPAAGVGMGHVGAMVIAVAGLPVAAVGAAVAGGFSAEDGVAKDGLAAAVYLGEDVYKVLLGQDSFTSTTVRSISRLSTFPELEPDQPVLRTLITQPCAAHLPHFLDSISEHREFMEPSILLSSAAGMLVGFSFLQLSISVAVANGGFPGAASGNCQSGIQVQTWVNKSEEDEFVGVGARFGHKIASEGRHANRTSLLLADPSACYTPSKEKVAGDILFVERGNCQFTTKAKVAESADASAIIFIDDKHMFYKKVCERNEPDLAIGLPAILLPNDAVGTILCPFILECREAAIEQEKLLPDGHEIPSHIEAGGSDGTSHHGYRIPS